jgi:hypothetical protein
MRMPGCLHARLVMVLCTSTGVTLTCCALCGPNAEPQEWRGWLAPLEFKNWMPARQLSVASVGQDLAAGSLPARRYTYNVCQDLANGRQKVVRDEVEEVLILVPTNQMYQAFPAYDKRTCWLSEVHGGTGPTLAAATGAASGGDGADDVEGKRLQRPLQQLQREQDSSAEEGKVEERKRTAKAEQEVDLVVGTSQQRRRLLFEEEGEGDGQAAGEAASEAAGEAVGEAAGEAVGEAAGEQEGQSEPYLFDFEKDPAKYLTFVSTRGWEHVMGRVMMVVGGWGGGPEKAMHCMAATRCGHGPSGRFCADKPGDHAGRAVALLPGSFTLL